MSYKKPELSNPRYSYLLGFLQADGTLEESSRGNGRVRVEVAIKDRDICDKLLNLIPGSTLTERTRNTNYKQLYKSIIWTYYKKDWRDRLKNWGLPAGRKTLLVSCPSEVSLRDYFRGFIDGDGALGFTNRGVPYINVTISSEALKNSFLDLVREVVGVSITATRTKRDGLYNLMLMHENAQKLVSFLYTRNVLSLDRKYGIAKQILKWKRPHDMRKILNMKKWTTEQDNVLLSMTCEEAAISLDRSLSSVMNRKRRLQHAL